MTNGTFIEDLTLVRLPAWWESPWFLLSAPLGVGLLLYAVTRWWARRPRPAPVVPAPSGPPIHEEFLRRLGALRARRPGMSAYELGIEVSTILRGYLEARFAFSAGFQTTREFLGSAAKDPRLHGDHRAMLASFLGLCDAVKFARHPASRVEQDGLLDTAERFIREAAGPGATPGDAP